MYELVLWCGVINGQEIIGWNKQLFSKGNFFFIIYRYSVYENLFLSIESGISVYKQTFVRTLLHTHNLNVHSV